MIKKIKALKSIRAYQEAKGYDSSLRSAQKMLECIQEGQCGETYSTFEAMEEIYKDKTKQFHANNYKLRIDYQSKEIECWLDGGDLSGTIGLKEVYHIEWTLKPKLEYHDVALKHILKGNFAEFEGETWGFEGEQDRYFQCVSYVELRLERKHFTEEKWILL